MNKFKIFLLVLLVAIAVVALVVYFIDAPVVEEGKEPTTAQKIIIGAKEKLGLIFGALGVTALGFIGFLVKAIAKAAKDTHDQSTNVSDTMLHFIEELKNENEMLKKHNAVLESNVTALTEKLDIQSGVLFKTLLLSDLPAPVRAEINAAKGSYDSVVAKVPDAVKSAAEVILGTVATNIEPELGEVEEQEQETTTAFFG